MTRERDPRVVKIAEKLAMAQPYGFEYVKSGPSAADYHAAIIAVNTLDEEAEWEYNIEGTDLVTGEAKLWRETWEPKPDWLKSKVEERDAYDDKLRNAGGSPEYTRRLVKRRKAGRIEDV